MKDFGEAAILCGGKSVRMGFDKSLAKINDSYMIESIYRKLSCAFETVKLCANSKEKFGMFDMPIVEDTHKGKGPAAAIHAVLSQAATKYVFVVACDMPLVNIEHVAFMKQLIKEKTSSQGCAPDALIPIKGGYIEPLYGFYSTNISKTFEEEIESGNFKIADILQKCRTVYMDEKYSVMFDKNLRMFTNLNYREDFEGIVWLKQ